MSGPTTITIHAVDLEQAGSSFRRRPLNQLIDSLPRGRVAAVCAGLDVDLFRPAGESKKHRRKLFEAIVEDLAKASLWDTPREAFDEAVHLVDLGDASGASAYPADIGDGGSPSILAIWCADNEIIQAAAGKVPDALAALPGQLVTTDPALVHDVLEELAKLLKEASHPGVWLLAEGDIS